MSAESPTTSPAPRPATQTAFESGDHDGRIITSAVQSVEAGDVEVSLSAIASSASASLDATGSAIGIATVSGNADASLSAIGAVSSKGNATVNQSYANAVIAAGDASMAQSAAPLVVSRTVTFDQGASLVTVSGSASASRSFIGLLLAGDAEVSEDSRVLITGTGVAIIAAAVLGGFALVAIALAYSANRVSKWRPGISLPRWMRRDRD